MGRETRPAHTHDPGVKDKLTDVMRRQLLNHLLRMGLKIYFLV